MNRRMHGGRIEAAETYCACLYLTMIDSSSTVETAVLKMNANA